MDPKYEHFRDFSSSGMSFPEKRKVWLDISDMSADAFDAMMAEHNDRQPRNDAVAFEHFGDLARDIRPLARGDCLPVDYFCNCHIREFVIFNPTVSR